MNDRRVVARWSIVLVLLIAAGAALGGCAKADRYAPPQAVAATAPAATRAGEGNLPAADRAMRITVETSIEVGDLASASASFRAAVARAGGYVGEARTSGSDEARYASFEAHVPVTALAAFRAEAGRLGDVVSETEKAEDVTEQRADIKARLANARAAEKRLLELLDKHTGSLADVVAVEKELAGTRETIERMEAQERVLEGQIALATVRVSLSSRQAGGHLGPGARIVRAAGEGVHTAGAFLVGLAIVAASSGPTVLLIAAMGYAMFRAVRFLALRAQARAKQPPR